MLVRLTVFAAGLFISSTASPVWAQSAPRYNWQVEVHGGGAFGTTPKGGTGSLPGPGVTFVPLDFENLPETRAVTSWAFGDGTQLFNEVAATLGLSPRITPLDPVLITATSRQRSGATFGLRLARGVTPRVSVEGSVEFNIRRGVFDDGLAARVDMTRASYADAFHAFFATDPRFVNPQVTVTTTFDDRRGYEAIGTGALVIRLGDGTAQPYLAIGGGVAGGLGEFPSFTLAADYQFTLNGFSIHQKDQVIVRQKVGIRPVGLIGGGLQRDLTPRLGFRVDGRLYLGGSAQATRFEALASSDSTGRVAVIYPLTSPALSFSSVPDFRSSLRGSSSITSFESSGMRAIGTITIGFFVRM